MGKRSFSITLALALVAGAFSVLPATAQEAPAVPDAVQIEDPYGDANTLGGDRQLGQDGGSQTDIGKVWFSHDPTNLNVHFLTEGPPTANSLGFQFVVTAGEAGCLVFDGFFDGATYTSENLGRVLDNCNGLDRLNGTFTFVPGPDGAGLATITVPRSYSPLFADGSSIVAPKAQTWIFVGGEQLTPSTYRGVRQMIDDTKVGTDYMVAGGGVISDPNEPKKPKKPKSNPPGKGKKKGCGKGAGKQKGACPTPPPASPACPPFVPGELGAEAETTIVTDAATAAAPVEVGYTAGRGGPHSAIEDFYYQNVQVDTAGTSAALNIKIEFPDRHDFDLYVYDTGGSEVDHSGDFNTIIESPVHSCGGTSCASGANFESVLALPVDDCGGYTIESVGYLTTGGEVTISMWLGEAAAGAAAEEDASRLFYAMTGLLKGAR